MEQRITFITLGVADLNKSRKFYEEAFGWKVHETSNHDIVFFKLNGMMLSLFPATELAKDSYSKEGTSGFKNFTIAYNVRSEAEVDACIASLRQHHATIVKEPQKVFWGGYSSYVADPDGFLWEIAFNPFLELDTQGNVV